MSQWMPRAPGPPPCILDLSLNLQLKMSDDIHATAPLRMSAAEMLLFLAMVGRQSRYPA